MRINETYSCITSLYIDWSDWLLNPSWKRDGHELTWDNNMHIKYKQRIFKEHVLWLRKSHQFSFQLIDGSLLQLYYRFHHVTGQLAQANLAYYKIYDLGSAFDDRNYYESLYSDIDIEEVILPSEVELDPPQTITTKVPCPWVRLDFEPDDELGVVHTASHLHLSLDKHVRIAVNGVPSPRQFFEMIMVWFYNEEYKAIHLNKETGEYLNMTRISSINYNRISMELSQVHSLITHLEMPSRTLPMELRGD